jgi:hypothetical protein
MFERIGRLAEQAAGGVNVSRRGFLGQLGKGAAKTAGVLAGLLVLRKRARASGGLQDCINRCCEATCGKADKRCACDPTGYAYASCYEMCVQGG